MKTAKACCAVLPPVLACVLLVACHQEQGAESPSHSAVGTVTVVSPAQTDPRTPAMIVGVVTPGPTQGSTSGQLKRFVARSGSKVRIEGTSNIHDWQVEGALIGGFLEATRDFPVALNAAKSVRVDAFISVRSLKSVQKDGRPYSDRMDEVMYECLHADDHGKVFYALSSLVPKGNAGEAGGSFIFDSVGTLAVAGVTNAIEMPVEVTPLPDNRLSVKGGIVVKMTSFGIQPPSPKWLGSLIKTGDEVKLSFEWTLAEKPGPLAMAH